MKKSYYTKLVGTSFDDRPKAIASMAAKNELRLRREKDNPYDPRAVAADAMIKGKWLPIGYISKESNEDLAKWLDNGGEVEINLEDITGGDEGKNYGVNVAITYGNASVDISELVKFKKLIPHIGHGEVYFDEENHNYYDEYGNQMISGSRFEDKYSPEVSFEHIAKALGKASSIHPTTLTGLWEKQGKLAADFGTAGHAALQLYFDEYETLKQLDEYKNRPHTPENFLPNTLGRIVKDFLGRFSLDPVRCSAEVFVRHENKCGFVDLLVEKDDKTFSVVDYKFVNKLKQVKYTKFGEHMKYTLQQNFYRDIIEANGYTVDSMSLAHFDGLNWHKVEVEKVIV